MYSCAQCVIHSCRTGDISKAPKNCPCLENDKDEILKRLIRLYAKTVAIPKEEINIKENEKVHPNTYEPMCNPIGQAFFLNKAKTDLNIILGLCVGHDALFIKYSEVPVTVLAVKDRRILPKKAFP